MIMCVGPEGKKIVHLEIGEGSGETAPGVKGYIDFESENCIKFTMNPDGSKAIKFPDNPKDAEIAKQELERGMGCVLSKIAGKPIDVTVDPEEGIVAKADIQMFLYGGDAFVNLGTPAKTLEEAKKNGAVERFQIATKMAYITGVK